MNLKPMQKAFTVLLVCLGLSTIAYAQSPITIGSQLPMGDEGMEEITGRNLSLNNIAEGNGLLVVFTSNTCPWVRRWQGRMRDIANIANDNNIGMVAINPNEGYRDRGDSLDDMIKHADKADYNFPYLLDEDHKIADAFGATRTPEVFLFNADLELFYRGAIDDNANSANGVQNAYVQLAIEAMVSGNELQINTSNVVGCTIKRSS